MINDLQPVWSQVEQLLLQGLSIIPVRDKDESLTDGTKAIRKSPYRKWKQFQSRIATKEELFFMMEQYDTSAVATICGKVSGNLEVIDIDVKWLPGVDARYFNDIKTLYPDLYAKIRIHKSPSGGFHLIYRVEEGFIVPGNQKLGRRMSSASELLVNPKEKIKCFLETRGEGGYVLAPPSLGYSVHQDTSIPVLSIAERESLIALARCYDQLIKEAEAPAKIPYQDDYYDTNPFEHYNQSTEGAEILLQHGWKQIRFRGGDYVHYTRPGGTDNTIHASFIISKRTFYIFTTNSELDSEKGYKPSTVLANLQFNKDKKKTFHYLVGKGYGVIKPKVEQRLIKNKAIQGKPLPANASSAAVQQHQELIHTIDSLHPHGTFWELVDDTIQINREGLYQVANGLGFRVHEGSVVHIRDQFFIHKSSEREFFDALKSYIKEEDAELYEDICNAFESFIQRAGKFTITRIEQLDINIIIKDTPQTSYKFYQNGYVFITAEKYSLNPYQNISGLIWHDRVQSRAFLPSSDNGKFGEFLQLSVRLTDNEQYIRRSLGYLAHEYKDSTTGYIIVFTERCEDPRHGGGSGKNLLASLLSHSTSYISVPGAQVRYNESFMQAWNGQKVFAVSDVDKKFNFMFLKDMSTNDGEMKKLYKDVVSVKAQDMPKFMVLTNYSFEISDGGLKRRIIPIEFTDFFTKCGGVDVHFDCQFPTGWTVQDWAGYDNFMASSIQSWLSGNMKLHHNALSAGGWIKQFDQSYWTATREFIEEQWTGWVDTGFVSNVDFNKQYNDFLVENNIHKSFSLSSTKMNRALHDWADKNSVVMKHNVQMKMNGINTKGREFVVAAPF